MTELKRCPFCGGEAMIRDYNGLYVECCDCHVRTPPFMYKHQNNAIAVWNTRPSPWHTGTPTEEGGYVCKLRGTDLYETHYFTGVNWDEEIIEKWQMIEVEK